MQETHDRPFVWRGGGYEKKYPKKMTGGVHMSVNQRGKTNPRYANGNYRRKCRARFKAMGAPCGICNGRLGEIHYDEPSDSKHPLSFVIDEIKPVSRWKQFGYESPAAAAQDWNNLQAAHYVCNMRKSDQILNKKGQKTEKKINLLDGEW